ncbi:hypothetical protein BG005_006087 [Podila minutissima]|nr:hypothetical protein BG005_006087 [Podila minutissima]
MRSQNLRHISHHIPQLLHNVAPVNDDADPIEPALFDVIELSAVADTANTSDISQGTYKIYPDTGIHELAIHTAGISSHSQDDAPIQSSPEHADSGSSMPPAAGQEPDNGKPSTSQFPRAPSGDQAQ